MANLLESSQNTATVAPDFYTNYLSNLAGKGTTAATNAQYVGAQPLQEKAFQDVGNLPATYQPTLQAAGSTLGAAGNVASPLGAATPYLQTAGTDPSQLASQYMSPYITNVVNALGDTGQRNIQQNLAPRATAGAVGSGQFGSQRGAQVLGQTISNAERDILNQQYQALNQGYGQALTAAGQQNALQAQMGSTAAQAAGTGQTNLTQLGNAQSQLAAQQQGLSLADINALSTLGGQQQTIAQNKELFPLNNLSTLSGMLRGYSVPTTTKTTASASPLSIVGGAITGTAGLFTKNAQGVTPYDSLVSGLSGAYNKMTGTTAPVTNPSTGLPSGTGYGNENLPTGSITTDSNGNSFITNADGTSSLYRAADAPEDMTSGATNQSSLNTNNDDNNNNQDQTA
jgi:hypothetical protein